MTKSKIVLGLPLLLIVLILIIYIFRLDNETPQIYSPSLQEERDLQSQIQRSKENRNIDDEIALVNQALQKLEAAIHKLSLDSEENNLESKFVALETIYDLFKYGILTNDIDVKNTDAIPAFLDLLKSDVSDLKITAIQTLHQVSKVIDFTESNQKDFIPLLESENDPDVRLFYIMFMSDNLLKVGSKFSDEIVNKLKQEVLVEGLYPDGVHLQRSGWLAARVLSKNGLMSQNVLSKVVDALPQSNLDWEYLDILIEAGDQAIVFIPDLKAIHKQLVDKEYEIKYPPNGWVDPRLKTDIELYIRRIESLQTNTQNEIE